MLAQFGWWILRDMRFTEVSAWRPPSAANTIILDEFTKDGASGLLVVLADWAGQAHLLRPRHLAGSFDNDDCDVDVDFVGGVILLLYEVVSYENS